MPIRTDELQTIRKALCTPSGAGHRPVSAYPEVVQDLGDILYDVPEQADDERYIDYAERIAIALCEYGFVIVNDPEAADTFAASLDSLASE